MKAAGSAFARPYVDALFEVAGSPDAVDALLPSLDTVARALESSEELRDFLANPGVGRKEKRALVASLARDREGARGRRPPPPTRSSTGGAS